MRILIDIVHPADVLFFRRPMLYFEDEGHELLVLSRHKDVACQLLDDFGIPHVPVSSAARGIAGLGRELLQRSWAVTRAAKRFRPDVMLGFGGLAISHAGKLLGIPSVAFYDSAAPLQTRLTWPFIDRLFVPQSYDQPVPQNTTRLRGVKELSYLSPDRFVPVREIALASGLEPNRENHMIRLVEWRANHDLGSKGWSERTLRDVVAALPGKVHISSEVPLPADLEPLRYSGRLRDIHHLLAHCSLYVGESATMASEAAILGVPAIYSAPLPLAYLDELEQAGLVVQSADPVAAISNPPSGSCDEYLARCDDWAQAVVDATQSAASGSSD